MSDILISSERTFRQDGADSITRDQFRKHMREMFGNTRLPAIVYKGTLIPERIL